MGYGKQVIDKIGATWDNVTGGGDPFSGMSAGDFVSSLGSTLPGAGSAASFIENATKEAKKAEKAAKKKAKEKKEAAKKKAAKAAKKKKEAAIKAAREAAVAPAADAINPAAISADNPVAAAIANMGAPPNLAEEAQRAIQPGDPFAGAGDIMEGAFGGANSAISGTMAGPNTSAGDFYLPGTNDIVAGAKDAGGAISQFGKDIVPDVGGVLSEFPKEAGRVTVGPEGVFGKDGPIGNAAPWTGMPEFGGGVNSVSDAVSDVANKTADTVSPGGGGYGGMPTMGDYQGIADVQGNLGANFQLGALDPMKNRLNMSGLNALEERATQKGPSAWYNMAKERQGLEETGLMNSAAAQAAGAEAGARANLAMRGGLRSGAGERLASSSANNAMLARQGVRQQGALERSNLGVQDEMFKMDALKQLPGAQLGAAQYGSGIDAQNNQNILGVNQYNIGNRIDDLGRRNQFGLTKYGEEMKGYAAGKTADAMAANQNPGLFGNIFKPIFG